MKEFVKGVLKDWTDYLTSIIIGTWIMWKFQFGWFVTPIPEIIHSIWEILI